MAKFGGGDYYQLWRKVELRLLYQIRCLQVLRVGQKMLVKVMGGWLMSLCCFLAPLKAVAIM